MKKQIALLVSILLLLALWGCSNPTPTPGNASKDDGMVQIGICLPDTEASRWKSDAAALQQKLTALGYQVFLENAGGDAQQQAEQVKALLSRPVDCLVIAAVDSLALQQELESAKKAHIPVLAYDRLLMNTDSVSAYVGFDALAAGEEIAQHLVTEKQLESAKNEARSYTIELFMGPSEDHNAMLFYQGAMAVLKSYFESGVLACLSGRVAFEDACLQSWDATPAEDACAAYIRNYYPETRPDILLAASDSLALGCVEALFRVECPEENWPYITGQDASLEAVQRLVSRQQAVTVYHDTASLIQRCVDGVTQLLAGKPFGEAKCHNGMVDVPASLLSTVLVTEENYTQVLIDKGIYTQDQIDTVQ